MRRSAARAVDAHDRLTGLVADVPGPRQLASALAASPRKRRRRAAIAKHLAQR